MPLPEPGDILLGKYRIESRLGAGGMGTVFAAEHLQLGGRVAIKCLNPDIATRPDIAERFLREAKAGRSLKGTHVATVYDIDKFGDVPFIVMEHLEGEPLSAYLARRGALPIQEAVDLILQACEPVSEAHTLGIVHRDLKPANLHVATPKGGVTLLKVLDFGISKFDNVAITSSDSALGTPLYMSPEQVNDAANVDARSDVWSLDVVLFEMLTGKRPFEGASRSAIYVSIKSGRRPRLRDLRADIPPRLEEAIDRAFALAPENRVPSVEAFAASIAEFGTKAAGASLERIQIGARPTSTLAPAPTETLAPVPTEAGREQTSLGASVAATPPPGATTKPPAASRSRVVAGIGALLLAAGVGTAGVRLHWFSSRAAVASTAIDNPACADGATPSCEAACTANEPSACLGLARALLAGKGAPRDPSRAATLYQAECDRGGMPACNRVGTLYDTGTGVTRDREAALSLFQKACTGGSGAGCVNVGNDFAEGKATLQDDHEALHFYQLGCNAGEALGCFNLSIFEAKGRGGPQNLVDANAYAVKACTMGSLLGCTRVAMTKITGEGVTKDTTEGLGELEAMCTRGEAEGCRELATLYEKGLGDVPAAPSKSAAYLNRACDDLHDDASCQKRDLQKTLALTSTMPARINAAYRDQCNAGSLASCESLGRNLMAGTGSPKNEVTGAEYLAKACSGGRKTACESGTR